MGQLAAYRNLDIDWDMTPEDAVILYLEWGNNSWHSKHLPVRSKNDVAHYFVVNTWEPRPIVFLIRRNSEEAVELAGVDLPEELAEPFLDAIGRNKGVYAITPEIRHWLEGQLAN